MSHHKETKYSRYYGCHHPEPVEGLLIGWSLLGIKTLTKMMTKTLWDFCTTITVPNLFLC